MTSPNRLLSVLLVSSSMLLAATGCQEAQGAQRAKPARALEPDNQVVHLVIEDMVSPACPVLVRKALEEVEGIRQVQATLKTRSVRVDFDATRITVAKIQSIIKDKVGFDSRLERAEKAPRSTAGEDCGCHESPLPLTQG